MGAMESRHRVGSCEGLVASIFNGQFCVGRIWPTEHIYGTAIVFPRASEVLKQK